MTDAISDFSHGDQDKHSLRPGVASKPTYDALKKSMRRCWSWRADWPRFRPDPQSAILHHMLGWTSSAAGMPAGTVTCPNLFIDER